MLPLNDDRPIRFLPWMNLVLIAANVSIFLVFTLPHPAKAVHLADRFGFVPANLFQTHSWKLILLEIRNVLSAAFLHGGWVHLLGNALYLWVFGNNVEGALGHFRYLVFYLACGISAALSHGIANMASAVPVIGASGAVAGVLGAYLFLYPRSRIKTLFFFGFFAKTAEMPAILLLSLWAVLQVLGAVTAAPTIAWYAHIGGFLTGLALAPIMKKRSKRNSRRT